MTSSEPANTLFVIDLTYTVSLERIDALHEEHVVFLEKGYEAGLFLFSGPKEPRDGGVIIACAASRALIETYLREDPFHRESCADYAITEFHPRMVADWIPRSRLR
ncbi:YciI family protein [Stappia sp. ES.058]|uniref:YciI family protein n=1 Tax=Stappia sp. ES.058 TaxID=1881061 RepID=UPI00087C67BD|nr:YciI family protein [Stappia sp. ES.058]SDT90718.1 Uncharacterized conserved protein YciI, contains a putative active-site phosphohistidine [Stappia sp. ES.058]